MCIRDSDGAVGKDIAGISSMLQLDDFIGTGVNDDVLARNRSASHRVDVYKRQPKLPHRVCPNCNYYDGKNVLEA